MLLRESKDPCVKTNAPALKSGDWNVSGTVADAESTVEFKKLLGYHQTSKAGLGSFHVPEVKERDSIIIELTSPCEENFEDRHKQKVDKYFPLCEAMRFN